MGIMPFLWIVWAVVTTTLLALLVYRSNLTRYEEDQLFLDDAGEHQQKEQQTIVAKVKRIDPFVRAFTVSTCVMTVAIVGFYVYDAIKQFNM
jgi:hypothetical protein